MNGHLYRFTVEYLEDSQGSAVETDPLVFETRTHDDIFRIAERMKGKIDLDESDTAAFAVGLKLFSEVMLKNKDNELFKQFKPHFKDFMKGLKKSS